MEVVKWETVKRDGGVLRTRIWLKCGHSMDKGLGFTGLLVTCRKCEPREFAAERKESLSLRA